MEHHLPSAGLLGIVVLVGIGKYMAEQFLLLYLFALGSELSASTCGTP